MYWTEDKIAHSGKIFNKVLPFCLMLWLLGGTGVWGKESVESGIIALDHEVLFLSPSVEDTIAGPGTYTVRIADEWIKLTPHDRERWEGMLIKAKPITHGESLEKPHVDATDTPGGQIRVAILTPEGNGLEAFGTYAETNSLVKSRGLRPRSIRMAQLSEESDAIPPSMVKQVELNVSLLPSKTMGVKVPLWNNRSLVEVSFVENKPSRMPFTGRLKKSRRSKPMTQSELMKDVQRRITKQQLPKKQVVSFTLAVGRKQVLPIQNETYSNNFAFEVPRMLGTAEGAGKLRNISKQRIKGRLIITSVDSQKNTQLQQAQYTKALEQAIQRYPSPDLLLALRHTIQRQVRGYPGGKSNTEKKFSTMLARAKVPNSALQSLNSKLDRFLPQLDKRSRNKSLSHLNLNQAIDTGKLNKIVKPQIFRTAPPEIVVFEYGNYGGRRLVVSGTLTSLRGKNFNDKISSVQVRRGKWQLCEHAHFQGRCYVVGANMPRLGPLGWNDKISSIRPVPSPPATGLAVYEHIGFGGRKLLVSGALTNLKRQKFNDKISSLQLKSGKWQLCEHTNFRGQCFTVSADVTNLVPLRWNDKISSIRPMIQQEQTAYAIKIIGVRSERCRGDSKRRQKCDPEEPFIVWSIFSPNYTRSGVTDWKKDAVVPGEEYLFREDTNALSVASNNTRGFTTQFPLFFIYQVIEKDKGGPTREDWNAAITSGVATLSDVVIEDWEGAAVNGGKFVLDTFELITKLRSDGDDDYPAKIAIFDGERLYALTSGSQIGPLNEDLFDSAGNYRGYSIQIADVAGPKAKSKRELDWKVVYIITKEDRS